MLGPLSKPPLAYTLFVCCFAAWSQCFADAATSYQAQESILHLCTTPSTMGCYLAYISGWGGLVACKGPMKNEIKSGLMTAYSYLFWTKRRTDFLYILSFLPSLPLHQSVKVNLLLIWRKKKCSLEWKQTSKHFYATFSPNVSGNRNYSHSYVRHTSWPSDTE